jgi:NodT family efflux transporter outer membrane factor (OMF) lipoprotein
MTKRSFLLLPAALVLASGCTVMRTDYERPPAVTPAAWEQGAATATYRDPWWESFDDPTLNALVVEVLRKNNDLAAATITLRKARLKADLAVDQLLPDWSATGTFTESQNLRGHPEVTRAHEASTTLSFEADLWGKLAATADAAGWEAAATEADRASTALSLIGTTVQLYFKLGYLNEHLALSEASIATAQKNLTLVQVQHKAGGASALEDAEATESLASQQAAHTQYLQQKVETKTALAILLDQPPEATVPEPAALSHATPEAPPAGLPAQLLDRRPDLRAAELRLREVLAEGDATRASYLPSLTLTGSLGSSSVALTDVLKNPIGTLGVGLALPFLNYFDMRKNDAIADADYEKAVVDFRQTLYGALAEVENALAARRNDSLKQERLVAAQQAAASYEAIATVRYREGYTDLQTLLEAQEKKRTADASVLENRYTLVTDAVTLFKALGGSARAE